MIGITFQVYCLADNNMPFDICAEFRTIESAREWIKKQKEKDKENLINDEYAIFKETSEFIE